MSSENIANTATTDVVCFGEAMVVVAPEHPAPLEERPTCGLSPAGAEFNVAAHLAGLGVPVQWLGSLGADPFARIILDEATQRGIGSAGVHISSDHPTGIYFKSPSETGTRALYYRSGSAAAHFDLNAFLHSAHNGLDRLKPRIVHTTGITPALSLQASESMDTILSGGLFDGALTSFDVNYRPALWENGDAAKVLLDLAQRSDIVFVGRDEAQTVWEVEDADDLRTLIDRPTHLIVKDGAERATEFFGNTRIDCPAPSVSVLEAVGAGDAFAAGWLTSYLRGRGADERLRLGHFMASQALRHPGDIFPPPPQEQVAGAAALPVSEWPTGWLNAEDRR